MAASFPKTNEKSYKGYKLNLILTDEQKQQLQKALEASRYTWNIFLALNEYLYHKNMHDNHPDQWQRLLDKSAELALKNVKRNPFQREIDDYNNFLKDANYAELYELAQPFIQKDLERIQQKNQTRKKKLPEEVQRLSNFTMANMITQLKKKHDKSYILNDPAVASAVPRAAVQNLDRAYQTFFSNIKHGRYSLAGKPRFHSKWQPGSCGYNIGVNPRAIRQSKEGMTLLIPKLGKVKAHSKRHLPAGKVKTLRVRQTPAGQYIASLTIQQGTGPALRLDKVPRSKMIGINLAFSRSRVLTLSNGEVMTLDFDKLEAAFARTQKWSKKLSVRKNGYDKRYAELKTKLESENRQEEIPAFDYDSVRGIREARHARAKAFQRLSNLRRYRWDLITTQLTRKYQVIVVPKYNLRGLSNANKYSKKLLSLASLGMFNQLLVQKERKYGCQIIEVNPAHTSQVCHVCGQKLFDGPTSRRKEKLRCPSCGAEFDLHQNAAINILNLGMKQLEQDIKAQEEWNAGSK